MLTQQITNSLEILPDAERGQAYSAIFAYIYTGKIIADDAPYPVRLAFSFAKAEIDRILERRRRAKERRDARKARNADIPPLPEQSQKVETPLAGDKLSEQNCGEKSPEEELLYDEIIERVFRNEYLSDNAKHNYINHKLRTKHPGKTNFKYFPNGKYRIVS